jgi:hypothetical protein
MRYSWWLWFAVACSSPHAALDGSSTDAALSDAAPLALGAVMPQATAGNPSAVMAAPTVVVITYDSDTNRGDTEAFYAQYAASPAWALQTAEYGIGPLTVGAPIHLSGPPAVSDAAVRALLASNLGGATPAWGVPSESTLYSFVLPSDAAFTDASGAKFCGGYHDDVLVGSVDVAYSIQLPCKIPSITPVQALTFTLAHELVEGVTDPRWEHDFAWGAVDPSHAIWAYVTDGELADLCEFAQTFLWTDAPGMTYAIQRIWSNAAARAGTDPCIGAPSAPYYQAVPDQPDAVTIALFGEHVTTQGTRIAVGASGAVTVHLAGAAGSGPFTVTAYDVATVYFGASTPLLAFEQPAGMFALGDTISIPVTVKAKDSGLGTPGAEAFEIDTKPATGPTTYFYGVVGQ